MCQNSRPLNKVGCISGSLFLKDDPDPLCYCRIYLGFFHQYLVPDSLLRVRTPTGSACFISRIFDSSYVLSCGHDFKFAV